MDAQAPEIFDTSYDGYNDRCEKLRQDANYTRGGGAHREIVGRINKTVI